MIFSALFADRHANSPSRSSHYWMRMVLSYLSGFCCITLLFASWNLKDPLLLPYRYLETQVLLGSCLMGIIFCLWFFRGFYRIVLTGLLFASLLITLCGEVGFHYRKAKVLSEEGAGIQAIGRHFIVGYNDPETVRVLASKGLIGGIFVTKYNAVGKTLDALRGEIAAFQDLRKSAGLPPLIVTTDQEGGIVSRLSPPLPKQPSLALLANGQNSETEIQRLAQAYGEEQGRALAYLGISVNFSPVVDLKIHHPGNLLDFHSLISQRAISEDPVVTANVAKAYIHGLEMWGVAGTLKHFPGLGRVTDDTHHFSATLDYPVSKLENNDWLPFRQVARDTRALIMLGHVAIAAMDKENPASLSRTVIQKIIRGQWQYEGILITDDLTMGAAYHRGLCAATVKAFNAGEDLLLISYDHEKFYDAMYCAIRASLNGQLDKTMLGRSQIRLLRHWPDQF